MYWCTGVVCSYLCCNGSQVVDMSHEGPLPLIVTEDSDSEEEDVSSPHLAQIGYAVIFVTWFLFFVSINSIFHTWRYIIAPLQLNKSTQRVYFHLEVLFSAIDNHLVSLWCIYIVCWWWALLSWIGLKLFRQSKGIQN